MLFNRPVSATGKDLHSSYCMLILAVSVIISAHDIDCTCFVTEAFSYNLHIIHII